MDFLPSVAILAAFSLTALIIILTPGPDMAYFLGKTLSHGRGGGIIAFLGTSTGLVGHTLLAALGLSALLAASATAFTALKIAGALYLLYLAVQAIRKGSQFTLNNGQGRKQGWREIYAAGLGINLLNPKIVLFFVTFLPQFVHAGDPHAASKLLFLGFYFLTVSIPICLALIMFADKVALHLRSSPKIMRVIDWIVAGIFGAFAVRLLASRT